MSEETKNNEKSEDLDNLLDEALKDFQSSSKTEENSSTSSSAVPKAERKVASSETGPAPSDPLQKTFEAMCFDDEKFLNELESLPNVLSNFPFGFDQEGENSAESNNVFNLFSELGKHAELLQKVNDDEIEKALEKLADEKQESNATASASATSNDANVEQLNMFMSGILSKDVMFPACQAVDESYEEWLTKHRETLTEEEKQRFTNQHRCVQQICQEYQTRSNEPKHLQRVLQKFQELQTYGDPPKELLFFPGLPMFGGANEQNLFEGAFADADKIAQSDPECSIM